ncbi:quinone oxidoreductase [Roseomonas sp. OT10]|uniref:quinone oxidoreductase family protein n=1 Tax=Roseomonas cutis TaxID=2897332 RepID=UPI001E283B29|nr:quinone oxidoreductase [Roseomonas sp. OT10]UFN48432.1 quinone oxidoreductase [Roseomonas sp. OT10]
MQGRPSRCVLIDRPGGPEVLRLESRPVGAPGPGEVLLRHTAIGVNFIDIQHRTGRYPLPSYPAPLGIEAAGVVLEAGPGVDTVRPGERVVYSFPPVGSYADLRVVRAAHLVAVPDGVGDELAAAAFNKGITAHYLLHTTYPVREGETILVHAAAGGVGSLLCQWASARSATVIGVVGSEEKVPIALANGCRHVVVHPRDDLPGRVRELTGGQGVPVVFDSVGRETFEASLLCLRPRGLLVSFGSASGPVPPFDLFRLNTLGSLYVTSPAYVTHTADRAELLARARDVFAALAAGTLRVAVGRRYDLADAAQAHRDLQARRTTGASILLPAPG